MKKIFIKIACVAVCMTVLVVNVSLSRSENARDTNLLEVSVATDANAECNSSPINNGKCSYFQNCFPDAGGSDNDCDSTKGY
ncbi:hypothetical protein FACS189426_19540 [Bacteroidia bacterium]|nr:hypothetical protein FACS189426_19540 [Bacteroidia bacterium]